MSTTELDTKYMFQRPNGTWTVRPGTRGHKVGEPNPPSLGTFPYEEALRVRDAHLAGETATIERTPTTRGYTPDIAADGTMDETDAPEGQDRQSSTATGAHGRYRQFLYDLGYRNVDAKTTYDKRDILGSAAVIDLEAEGAKTIIVSAVPVPPSVVDYAWVINGVNILHVAWKDEG